MIIVPFILIATLFVLTLYLSNKNKCIHDCSKCEGCSLFKEMKK